MAKYKLNSNVRLKGTFIVVYIVDIFEDATETRYAVITENGQIFEKKESELRPTFRALWKWICWEVSYWCEKNPDKVAIGVAALTFLFGLALGTSIK